MRNRIISTALILFAILAVAFAIAEPERLTYDVTTDNGLMRFLRNPIFPGDIKVTGTATMSGDATVAGDIAVTGTVTTALRPIEVETGTSETVLSTESGKIFSTTLGTGTVTYTLPTASTGLTFTFIDASATAGDDLWITAGTGDTINSGTVAKSYVSTADAVPSTVTLVAISAGSWEVISEVGASWANDNN